MPYQKEKLFTFVKRNDAVFGLRRITSSGNFIPEIDGLRFIAILSVVLFHIYGFLDFLKFH